MDIDPMMMHLLFTSKVEKAERNGVRALSIRGAEIPPSKRGWGDVKSVARQLLLLPLQSCDVESPPRLGRLGFRVRGFRV